MEKRRFGPYIVELSNQDKVLFPQDGITKGDLVEYYSQIAETMVPHMKGRPVVMQRFPDGITGEIFYQKQIPDYFPDWIQRISVEKEGGQLEHVVCENAATLAYLANQACCPHLWLSRIDRLNYPNRMIFDLDPSTDDFEQVRSAAQELKALLEDVGLASFLMTTGSRGLHVVVPLDRSADFDTVRAFARDIAEVLASRDPDSFTTEPRKDRRRRRIFLDYLRNAYAQTAVAVYSVRPKPGAPVATALDWAELGDSRLHPQSYNIQNIFRRLGQKSDPWREMSRYERALTEPRVRLDKLISKERFATR